ncbi:MAG TPA: phage tail protein [Roseiflexaceae bacterium]
MTTDDPRPGLLSRYLEYLPAIFQMPESQDDQGAPAAPFLGRFLLAFEQVLTGLGDVESPGVEEILDGIPPSQPGGPARAGVQRYFDPGPGLDVDDRLRAPREFLEWLAGWVALAPRADIDELRQRDLIARAVSLYRLRGTKRGLEEMIRIYTRLAPTIDELSTPFQIGVHSRIGVDTWLDGGVPHFFRVTIRLPTLDPARIQTVRAIIDTEKPAHTFYYLDSQIPTLRIGVTSRIGVDTLLSPPPAS